MHIPALILGSALLFIGFVLAGTAMVGRICAPRIESVRWDYFITYVGACAMMTAGVVLINYSTSC